MPLQTTNPCCLLVVDDHHANVVVLTYYLSEMGLEYDIATNGLDALDKVARRHYSLILMDINMPVMDGIEATLKIREFEKESQRDRQPVIAVTAYPILDLKQRVAVSGAADHIDSFISKPLDQGSLKTALAGFL